MLDFDEFKLVAIGLGYVGLPLAIEFGKPRSVLGFDINVPPISALEAGHCVRNLHLRVHSKTGEGAMRCCKFWCCSDVA